MFSIASWLLMADSAFTVIFDLLDKAIAWRWTKRLLPIAWRRNQSLASDPSDWLLNFLGGLFKALLAALVLDMSFGPSMPTELIIKQDKYPQVASILNLTLYCKFTDIT